MKLVLKVFATSLISCVAIGTNVSVARETPPPSQAPRAFVLPTPETFTLENGLQVTLVPFGSVPKVSIAAVVRTGRIDQGTQPWLPDLVGDLMKEGTQLRSSAEVADAAARMGSGLDIDAGDDDTSVSLDVLSDSATDAVALIAEVLTKPLLPEAELPRLKQDAFRNLSVTRSQAQALANIAFGALIYGNHPYAGQLPSEAQLDAYTIGDIRTFYDKNFGAQRTHVYVVGKYERAPLEQAIRTAFSHWKTGSAPTIAPPTPNTSRQVKLVDRPGARQSTVRLGLPVIDPTQPDFMALSVANTLLGGSLTSRITMNLREEKGWTYSPSSSLSTHYRSGTWFEGADITTPETGPAIREIYKEIERLQTDGVSAPELKHVQDYRNGLFVLANGTRQGLLGQLAFMDVQGLPFDWLSSFIQRLYAVTPAEVAEAARKYLDVNRMSLVVVGDLKTVQPQLESAPAHQNKSQTTSPQHPKKPRQSR